MSTPVRLLDLIKQVVPVSYLKKKGPGNTWLYRQTVRSYLEILAQTQLINADQMWSLQSKRLGKILRAAARTKWWPMQFAQIGLDVSAPSPIDELKKIPPQNKSMLVRVPPDHLRCLTNTEPLLWRTTTGVAGIPIAWAQDRRSHFIEYAAYYLRSLEHFSFPVRENLTRNFFLMFNYPGVDEYYLAFFARGASMPYTHQGKLLSPEERNAAYGAMNITGPWVLYGAPSALWFLAQQVEKDGVKINPDLIVFSGEMMPGNMRLFLEKIFSCPVRAFYGTRELGTIGFSCGDSENTLHLNSEHIYLEIINEKGEDCAFGEYGNMTMTSLTNRAMPLLRYQPGDTGRFVDKPCACKTTLPRFELVGRTGEFIVLPDGRKIPFWSIYESLFADGRFHKIHQYQIRQIKENALVIYLVEKPEWTIADTEELRSAVKKELGEAFKIEIKFVKSIEATGRKRRPFIALDI